MKVSIELFKGKKLANENYPIVIRITHKGKNKYKSTGISIKENHWNKDKSKITCREENFRIKNNIIFNEFSRIQSRAIWFEQHNYPFDFDFIVSNIEIDSYNPNQIQRIDFDSQNFINIIQYRISAYDKQKTRENYSQFLNIFRELYGDYVDCRCINQYFVDDYRRRLDNSFPTMANKKNHLLKCFNVCYNYGIANRWILNPFRFEIKRFPYEPQERNISYEDFTAIINIYKKLVNSNANLEEYQGLAIFILDIAFQGLSPIDLALIKISDLKLGIITEDNKDFELYNNSRRYRDEYDDNHKELKVIKIRTFRSKTGIYVPIVCEYTSIRPILEFFCKNKTADDYLLDCFNKDIVLIDKQVNNRCGHYFNYKANNLNRTLLSFSGIFGIPSVDRITYYYARHAFINALDKIGIEHNLIRKMVGHKKHDTLQNSYISKATDWEQAMITNRILNNVKPVCHLELQAKGKESAISDWQELENLLIQNK